MTAMKEMNCNRSLIFVLGNLDEAFGVEGDLNPDIDADVFYDKTSSVSITDIKNALKERLSFMISVISFLTETSNFIIPLVRNRRL